MADLFGEGAEGPEVAVVEADARVGAGQERQGPALKDHAERDEVALLGHERAAATAGVGGGFLLGEQEFGDGGLGLQGVQGLQPALHVEQEARRRGAQCSRPSPGPTGAMPRSARRTAARRLPVCTHRS